MSVELLLMLRGTRCPYFWCDIFIFPVLRHHHLAVCEMYNNDKYIIGILLVLAGAQFSGMAVATRMIVPIVGFSPTCVAINYPQPNQIYAA
jgi:hypothetical protein